MYTPKLASPKYATWTTPIFARRFWYRR